MSDYPYCPPPVEPVSFIFVARFLQEKEFMNLLRLQK